jgi:hypothetical protein
MAEVPVPLTEEEIDTSDPTNALMAVGMLIVGFGVFSMTQSIGDRLANTANSALGQVLGQNPATGEDSDDGLGVL